MLATPSPAPTAVALKCGPIGKIVRQLSPVNVAFSDAQFDSVPGGCSFVESPRPADPDKPPAVLVLLPTTHRQMSDMVAFYGDGQLVEEVGDIAVYIASKGTPPLDFLLVGAGDATFEVMIGGYPGSVDQKVLATEVMRAFLDAPSG
jgi:hypothetical protein